MNRTEAKRQTSPPSLHVVNERRRSVLPPQAINESLDEEINLLEYWLVFKRHFRSIVGITFVFALMGALYAFSITPQYASTVTILVKPESPDVTSLEAKQGSNIWFFYETQYALIQSRSVVGAAVDKLKLEQHPFFIGPTLANGDSEPDNGFWQGLITGSNPAVEKPIADQKTLDRQNKRFRDDVVDMVQGGLSVKGLKEGQLIDITYMSPDAELSALAVNAIAEAYINKGLEAKFILNQNITAWLNKRLSDLRQKLELSENALLQYKNKEGLVDSKSIAGMVSGKLGGITAALMKAQEQLTEAEILKQQVKILKSSGKNLESLPVVLKNTFIQQLKSKQVELARQVSELSERYGEKHPKMISAIADLDVAKHRLSKEVNKVINGLSHNYDVAEASVQKLQALSLATEKNVRGYQSKEFKLAKLERDVSINRRLYDLFVTRFKETSVAGDSAVSNAYIVDRARVARGPSKPNKKLIVTAALFAGLFLGVLLAFLLEYLQNTFRLPHDVEKKLGLPLLGILPMLSKENILEAAPERYAFSEHTSSAFIEGLNYIRTNLMFTNIDVQVKVIMVTSSVANEGKTTLSSNLACNFSRTGKTLLIDGDLRKQQLSKSIAGETKKPGLVELAAGEASLDGCIVQDGEENNLFHIGQGLNIASPLELLSSKKFEDMMDMLRDNFDHIIIDSAPILSVSDSLILGSLADEIVLVVKADSTTEKMAQESCKRLKLAHLRAVGVVLQQADLAKIKSYGSYDYSYNYLVT